MNMSALLHDCFLFGINAVQPQNLLPHWLRRKNNSIYVGKKKYTLRNSYIVGFGKAVAGMIPPLVQLLKNPNNFLKEGIISIPCGALEATKLDKNVFSQNCIQVIEGAKDNLPDDASKKASEKILTLARSLTKNDILFVLISGGGSALLSLPVSPLDLNEKVRIIRSLSLSGASITEVNSVRKMISATKGGKLAIQTKASVISLILSDIIGSPLSSIASGPTVFNEDDVDIPANILHKYNIPITQNLDEVVKKFHKKMMHTDFSHVQNVLIGDNETALNSIKTYLQNLQDFHCIPVICSLSLNGEASKIGTEIAQFSYDILNSITNCRLNHDWTFHFQNLSISSSSKQALESAIAEIKTNRSISLFLLFGGETTVKVKGDGRGGRNQEMVLSASLEYEKLSSMQTISGEIWLLSGGTDGIDGPTDAAGAITYLIQNKKEKGTQVKEARQQGLEPEEFLRRNASYEYFSSLSGSKYLIKTGHTGTNVMDIQLVCIKANEKDV